MATSSLDQVRSICADLPECELTGDQHHKLTVRGKTLGWHTVDHHGDGRVALSIKAAKVGPRCSSPPTPPGSSCRPTSLATATSACTSTSGPVDWDEIRELVTDAYRLVAPKALVKQLDR